MSEQLIIELDQSYANAGDGRKTPPDKPIHTAYIVGLDLGQAADFTALAVLERKSYRQGNRLEHHHAVRHLERFTIGTSYLDIIARLVEMFAKKPLRNGILAVDQTAVAVGGDLTDSKRQHAGAALSPGRD